MIKRLAWILLALVVIGIIFRGWLYRHMVEYKSIGHRNSYSVTDHQLINLLNEASEKQADPNVEDIIELALSITSQQLHYTTGRNDNNPNMLVASRKAHCVGYAAFFATACNFLFEKHNLAGTWTATSQIGQIYFLRTNIHSCFNSSFFKDHDFVTIENKINRQKFAVDPTVSDYLYIDFVTIER